MANRVPTDRRRDLPRIIDALESVIAGRTPRSSVTSLTRELWPDSAGQGTPFPSNGTATTIFDSIWNIEARLDDHHILRDADLQRFICWLREGDDFRGLERIAWVNGSPESLAAQRGVSTVRYWVDGLGWHESFSVVSPVTGRRFVGVGPMMATRALHTVDVLTLPPHHGGALEDLFDTFVIDHDDLFQPPAVPLRRWELWRQDDNGVRALVASFTGRAKAEAALERFEALAHKQAYWLEDSGAQHHESAR